MEFINSVPNTTNKIKAYTINPSIHFYLGCWGVVGGPGQSQLGSKRQSRWQGGTSYQSVTGDTQTTVYVHTQANITTIELSNNNIRIDDCWLISRQKSSCVIVDLFLDSQFNNVSGRLGEFTPLLSLFFQVVVDTSLESPAGLAIDWVTNKLYWTDAGKQPHFTYSYIYVMHSVKISWMTWISTSHVTSFLRYGSYWSFKRWWKHADCPDLGEPGPAQGRCCRPSWRVGWLQM